MMARRIVVAMLVVLMALAGIVPGGSEAIAQYKGGSAYKPPPPAYKPPQAYKPQTQRFPGNPGVRTQPPPTRKPPLVKPQRPPSLGQQSRQTAPRPNALTPKVLPYKQRPKLFTPRATPGSPHGGKTSRRQLTDQQKQARKDRLAILRAKPLPPRSGGGGSAGSMSSSRINRPKLTTTAGRAGSTQTVTPNKPLSLSTEQRVRFDNLKRVRSGVTRSRIILGKGNLDQKRIEELSFNHEQKKMDRRQGLCAARYELATGRKLKLGTEEGVDVVDDKLGPVSLKGPLRDDGKSPREITNMHVDNLAKSILKDVRQNTATKSVVVDMNGMSQEQRNRLQERLILGLRADHNPQQKSIFFLE